MNHHPQEADVEPTGMYLRRVQTEAIYLLTGVKVNDLKLLISGVSHYANGKWKMENGKWKMENGKWKMENGKWKMEN